MEATKFSRNYSDVSRRAQEVDAGFQFEFYCDRCRDTWRSPFRPYTRGQVAGWLSRASSLFSGYAYSASRAVSGFAEAGWGEAREEAFRQAIKESEEHFQRCARCNCHACTRCWNTPKALCLSCAPDRQAEAEQTGSEAEVAPGGDIQRAAPISVCPTCQAPVEPGSKFCSECGCHLANARYTCAHCSASNLASAKFCTDCGTKTLAGGAARG